MKTNISNFSSKLRLNVSADCVWDSTLFLFSWVWTRYDLRRRQRHLRILLAFGCRAWCFLRIFFFLLIFECQVHIQILRFDIVLVPKDQLSKILNFFNKAPLKTASFTMKLCKHGFRRSFTNGSHPADGYNTGLPLEHTHKHTHAYVHTNM